jgi:hypothetical protein
MISYSKKYQTILKASIIALLLLTLTTLTTATTPHQTPLNPTTYQGHLRLYVVEPTSRWNDNSGTPYHFGFLEFAYDNAILIDYLDTYTDTINWNGDITEDNVMVIAAVFNPTGHQSYAYPPSTNPFTAYYVDAAAAAIPGTTDYNTQNENYTHTVFIEEGTATWCSYCPIMAEALHTVYNSSEYPFYYAAMISDKSTQAANRLTTDLNLYGFPTAYFDGGYKVLVGGVSGTTGYTSRIKSSGQRDVHDLNLSLTVEWQGNGNIQIDISITNQEEITAPIIQIGDISSTLTAIQANIQNIGGAEATNIPWTISIQGGILDQIDSTTESTITTLPINTEEIIQSTQPLFGFGKVTVTVTAGPATKINDGFVIGPFIILV